MCQNGSLIYYDWNQSPFAQILSAKSSKIRRKKLKKNHFDAIHPRSTGSQIHIEFIHSNAQLRIEIDFTISKRSKVTRS